MGARGEDPRRDHKRTRLLKGKALGIQIFFLTAVVVCSVLSYYATSVRMHRSAQSHEEARTKHHTDYFLLGKDLTDAGTLRSLRGAFTLPWDDWPTQQVHSLFFAHKELARTEEFDREELGILRELEARERSEREVGVGGKGDGKSEQGGKSEWELGAGEKSKQEPESEGRTEQKVESEGGKTEREGRSERELEVGGKRDRDLGTGAASNQFDLVQRANAYTQKSGNDTGTKDQSSPQSTHSSDSVKSLVQGVVDDSAQGKRNSVNGSSVNKGTGTETGTEVGGFGADDDRGNDDRQMRIQRGQFEADPGLFDPISNEGYQHCVERDSDWSEPSAVGAVGYLLPALDGGLSQQIFEIANAVAIARILNVTLVVPEMRADAFWKDGSDFESIFDLRHFKAVLSDDISVVTMKELPAIMRRSENWIYVDRVQDGLPGDYRRALGNSFRPGNVTFLYSMWAALNHGIDPALEKLRCRAKYQAMRFSPTVVQISDALQERMRRKAGGPFLAVHLRFEVDMVMHQAGCDYGIDDPEEGAFWVAERKRREWPEPRPNELMRKNGYCPPTPEEIGKWLQGLGFNRSTQVYLASGKAYHEDVFLPPFLDMFPNTFKKEDLLTADEKKRVKGKNNLLAAIDFGVLAEADVVALTFHGVMKLSIQGHRSWNGFHKTLLYPNWESWNFRDLEWKDYRKRVRETTPMGKPSRRTKEEIVEVMGNPIPECMCRTRERESDVR